MDPQDSKRDLVDDYGQFDPKRDMDSKQDLDSKQSTDTKHDLPPPTYDAQHADSSQLASPEKGKAPLKNPGML